MIISSILSNISITMIIPFVDRIVSGKTIQIPQNIAIPNFLVNLISYINNMEPLKLLNFLILFFGITLALKEVAVFFQTYFMNDLSQKVIRDLKDEIYEKLLLKSLSFFSKNPSGKLVSKITFDAVKIRDTISEGVLDLLYQPIQLILYFTTVLFVRYYFGIPWFVFFVSMVVLPSVIYPVIKIGHKLKKISISMQEKMGDINKILYDTISGIRIVQAFSMEKYELDKFKKENRHFYKISMKSVKRMIAVSPITELVANCCVVAVSWIAGKYMISGELSAGAFFAFIAALLSTLKPFKRLSKVYTIIQDVMAAAERVFEVIDNEEVIFEKPNPVIIKSLKHEIVYNNVYFGYEKEKNVLSNINFKVKAGQVIALVGPSGAGKTTIANLLPRFYDVDSGYISIDDIDIRDASVQSLRSQIGIVTQDMILFNETVADNIRYGHTSAKMDDIIRAAQSANAQQFIENMPEGYNTIIGERGFKISGGEKQRLAIARAIFKNPPILIFDEATSQLDAESELLVQDAINKLLSNRTVFVIAHRLSTVKRADKILVVENGQIIEEGNHSQLIETGGLYKKLYDMQFAI